MCLRLIPVEGRKRKVEWAEREAELWYWLDSLNQPHRNSEAEMKAHLSCSKLGRNGWAFICPCPSVTGWGCSPKGGRGSSLKLRQSLKEQTAQGTTTLPIAGPTSFSLKRDLGSILMSILGEYLVMWRNTETPMLIFFFITHWDKGEDFCIHDKIRESFAKISTANVVETTGLNRSSLWLVPFTMKCCCKDSDCIGEQKNPQQGGERTKDSTKTKVCFQEIAKGIS